MKEYKIDVTMEPHYHDNPREPYFWAILGNSGSGWCNEGCGWASSVDKAWDAAKQYYKQFINANTTRPYDYLMGGITGGWSVQAVRLRFRAFSIDDFNTKELKRLLSQLSGITTPVNMSKMNRNQLWVSIIDRLNYACQCVKGD